MPTHVRKQIRDAVGAALTGLTTTAARVYVNRALPVTPALCPCLVVTIDTEAIEEIGIDPLHQRGPQIAVDGYVAALAAVDDTLDTIGLEVETAMAGAGFLGGLVKKAPTLTRVQIGIDESHEKPLGRIRMTYTTHTYTAPAAPGVVI